MLSVMTLLHCSCGKGLKTLFATPSAQHFINSVPVQEANQWKAIYQPGTLRKAGCYAYTYTYYCPLF